uniref:Uncharacterized protein n=1 Tax=Oryza sativa subsp. japonica TaxID=39947 RepID=Q6Z3Q2_ORYSJ|nr:hypothetical protein [Oryza sativa Japonica Group]
MERRLALAVDWSGVRATAGGSERTWGDGEKEEFERRMSSPDWPAMAVRRAAATRGLGGSTASCGEKLRTAAAAAGMAMAASATGASS